MQIFLFASLMTADQADGTQISRCNASRCLSAGAAFAEIDAEQSELFTPVNADNISEEAAPADKPTTESEEYFTENAVSDSESVPNSDVSVGNVQQESALSRIPVDEQTQEPMFEQAPDLETAWDGLVEAVGGGTKDAAEIAQAQANAITTELRKLTSKPPKLSGSPMQMAAQKREHQEKIDALQARLDTWNGILGVNAEREMAKNQNAVDVQNADREPQREETTGIAGDARGTGEHSGDMAIERRPLSKEDAQAWVKALKDGAEEAVEVPLTIENWDALFGELGVVSTPIEDVVMGENQFVKLCRLGRKGKLGMVKPTLENPDIVVEEESQAKEGQVSERDSSRIYIKSFTDKNGERIYHFTSVTVKRDGTEIVISNQEKSPNRIANLLQNGTLIWANAQKFDMKDLNVSETQKQTVVSVEDSQSDTNTTFTDSLGISSSKSSEGKVSDSLSDKQGDSSKSSLNEGVEQVANEPTEAQKKAGNYKKKHVRVDGHEISIENERGSVRRGTDADGKQWETEMKHDYGYIRGTESVDGDHIDVFMSEHPESGDVFVVDQIKEDGSFDEHKVMYGFGSEQEARDAYLSNYEDGWQGLGRITHVSKDEFKKWIQSSKRKTKPFAEYKSVNSSNNLFQYYGGSLRDLISEAKDGVKGIVKKLIAPVSIRLQDDLFSHGLEISADYNHVIDNNAIRHALKNHGGKSEEKRGQVPLIEEDFERIEDIVENYDNVTVESGKRGGKNIIYSKSYPDGTTIFVEEQRTGRRELAAVTMWKLKKSTLTDAKSTETPQISDLGATSEHKVNTSGSDKQAVETESSDNYTIDRYTQKGKKKNRELVRVVFPHVEKSVRQERLNLAKEMGGEMVPNGYGFKTEEEARAFAEAVLNPDAVADAQPLSKEEIREATERC